MKWLAKESDKWGMKGPDGNTVIPWEFDHYKAFRNGLATVARLEAPWGFLDENGKRYWEDC